MVLCDEFTKKKFFLGGWGIISGYAKAAVKAIGYESLVSPYWPHKIQIAALEALPE